MKILGYDPYVSKDQFDENEVTIVDLDTLTKESDYITLHLPINDSTRNLFDYNRLSMMKRTSRIINVARGGIINENDLSNALNNDIISGAAIDVFEEEPYSGNLCTLDNCLITSHMGSMTEDCRSRMEIEATEEVRRYINGEILKFDVPKEEYEN